MIPLSPEQAAQLVAQRQTARRTMAQGRRWYLRAVLLVVIAAVAGYRGGQANNVLAAVMVVLAAMCVSLGRSMRRAAQETERKIDLMEKSG